MQGHFFPCNIVRSKSPPSSTVVSTTAHMEVRLLFHFVSYNVYYLDSSLMCPAWAHFRRILTLPEGHQSKRGNWGSHQYSFLWSTWATGFHGSQTWSFYLYLCARIDECSWQPTQIWTFSNQVWCPFLLSSITWCNFCSCRNFSSAGLEANVLFIISKNNADQLWSRRWPSPSTLITVGRSVMWGYGIHWLPSGIHGRQ